MSAKLVFQSGSSSGTAVDLGDWELTVGREPACDVVLPDEVVSRQQASFHFEDGLYVLRDLGSTNGTFVNNRKVHEQVLRDGDVIEFGLGGPEARFQQEVAAGVGKTVMVSKEALSASDSEFHCARCGTGISVTAEVVSSETAEYVSIDQASIPDFCPNCGEQIDKENIGDLLATAPSVVPDVGRTKPVGEEWMPPTDEAPGDYDSSVPDPVHGGPQGTMTAMYHEARDIVRAEGGRPTTGLVMKEFVRLAYAKSRRRTRLVALFAFLLTIGISSAVYFRARAETERVRQESEQAMRAAAAQISGLDTELETLEQRRLEDQQTMAGLQAQAGELQAELAEQRAKVAEVGYAEDIAQTLAPGVGLIYARVRVRHPDGRLVRRVEEADGTFTCCTLEGSGPLWEVGGQGTGFLIDEGGWVVTNGHVVLPPEFYAQVILLGQASNVELEVVGEYTVWFPPGDKKYTATVEVLSGDADVAILQTGQAPAGVPALPLASRGVIAPVGRETVLIGYPRAEVMVLSYADADVLAACAESAGSDADLPSMLDCLGARGLVSPMVTMGSVTSTSGQAISYQGGTTQGSSGGPLLDASGEVIGVNFMWREAEDDPGEFRSYDAVPIDYVWQVLPEEVRTGLAGQ